MFCSRPQPLSREPHPATVHSRPCPHVSKGLGAVGPARPACVLWLSPLPAVPLHWPPCRSPGTLGRVLPQGLCPCRSLCRMLSLGIPVACFFTSLWVLMKCPLHSEASPPSRLSTPDSQHSSCTCRLYVSLQNLFLFYFFPSRTYYCHLATCLFYTTFLSYPPSPVRT